MYWIVKNYYIMVFFTKTISQIILRSKQRLLDDGSHAVYKFYLMIMVLSIIVLLIFLIVS
jgi:hypothetical protein